MTPLLLSGFVWTPLGAGAQSIQQQINQLQTENANLQTSILELEKQATSFQDAINILNAQITQLQGRIAASEAERARLLKEITAAEAELIRQKKILAADIRQSYFDGQISTFEILAASENLSEYIDKQQYLSTVQEKIKTTIDRVNQLKQQLKTQKEAVELLLKQQKEQETQLQASQAEQQQLLAYNQQQRADYSARTANNQARIDELIELQRRSNFNPDGGYYFLRFPGGIQAFNPNNYPYSNAGFGMSPGPGCVDGDGPDEWGYCTRQCVSYAAWAVQASGRTPPLYYGNARDWVAAAYAHGIPVYRTPQVGDIAISTAGFWGHAMYVSGVNSNSFTTSEYNTYLDGSLSYQTRSY